MEKSSQLSFIETYFRGKRHFASVLMRAMLVFVIAQQIYFPQQLKYFHLAILFTYMIFLDFFKDDQWAFYDMFVFLSLVFGCSVVSIVEKITMQHFSMIYLVLLMMSIVYTIKLIWRIYDGIKMGKVQALFTKRNQEALSKGTTFIKTLLVFIMTLLIATFGFVGYELIRLF